MNKRSAKAESLLAPEDDMPFEDVVDLSEPPAVISLTQDDINEISPLLGRNLSSKKDLLVAINNLSTVNCDGVAIVLEPGLLQRLKSRAVRRDFKDYLKETVKRLLHSEVGW